MVSLVICPRFSGVQIIIYLFRVTITAWWFQTFGLFVHHIWDNHLPIDEVIFFNMVKTNNQNYIYDHLPFTNRYK